MSVENIGSGLRFQNFYLFRISATYQTEETWL